MSSFINELRNQQVELAGRISESLLEEAGSDRTRLWVLLGEAAEPHLADETETDVAPLTDNLPVIVALVVISYMDWLAHAIVGSGTMLGHGLAEPEGVDLDCIAERYGATKSLLRAVIAEMRHQESLPLLGRVLPDGALEVDEAAFAQWNGQYVRA
jgi:hypothetical protein